MSNFVKAKKTYTKAEVEDYIKKMMTSAEITITEQRDTISSLQKTIDNSNQELSKIKEREARGMQALALATKHASELEKLSKGVAATKLIELEQFSFKWQAFFEELAKKYNIEESKFKLKDFALETKNMIELITSDTETKTMVEKEIKTSNKSKASVSSEELDRRYENILKRVGMLNAAPKKRGRPKNGSKKAVIELSEVMTMPKDSLNRILSELL